MKKFTQLLFIIIMPSIMFSQNPFTFDADNDGDDIWTTLGGFTTAFSSGHYDLTAVVTDPAKKNPTFATATANIDAATNSVCAITLKNSSATGPTYLRVSIPNGGGRTYVNLDMSNNDSDFKTYYFDLNGAAGWSGTVNDIKFHFKTTGNTDYVVPATPATTIEIDEIKFYAAGTASYSVFVQNPDFDDTEGLLNPWDINTATGTTVNYVKDGGRTGGALAINYSGAMGNGDVKVENNYTYTLSPALDEDDSVNLNYYHMLANGDDATAEEVQICVKLSIAGGGTKTFYQGWETPLTSYSPAIATRALDDGDAGTTNSYTDITVFFRVRNGNSDTVIYLDDITTSVVGVLSIEDSKISEEAVVVYPNPVKNVLNVSSEEEIALIELYSLVGQKVLSTTQKSVDASGLNTGMYLAKITLENGSIITKQFYKH